MDVSLSCLSDDSVHVSEFGGEDCAVIPAVLPAAKPMEHTLNEMEHIIMLPIEATEEICQDSQSFCQTEGQSEYCWKEVA
jgi:hypothetical protein